MPKGTFCKRELDLKVEEKQRAIEGQLTWVLSPCGSLPPSITGTQGALDPKDKDAVEQTVGVAWDSLRQSHHCAKPDHFQIRMK